MAQRKKSNLDADRIMTTIDHIDETISALSNILNRLRNYVDQQNQEGKSPATTEQTPTLNIHTDEEHRKIREEYQMRVKKSRILH